MSLTGKKIYDKFYPQLVSLLPMKDAVFTSNLVSLELLSCDLKATIESKETQKEAAECFLDRMIKPAVECGNNITFYLLIAIMENIGDLNMKNLTQTIRKETQKTVKHALITGENKCKYETVYIST